jgi:hypothetical protein
LNELGLLVILQDSAGAGKIVACFAETGIQIRDDILQASTFYFEDAIISALPV